MRHIQTEVLVIGGGSTGTGILRDLALRGFKCVLVERRDLAYGTTGRYHGLLHSGGRYAVKDPQAARECIEENRILRRIMPYCIEDTGGFFVTTPWDDPAYAALFIAGCRAANIPVESVSISTMLKEEPLLNPHISQCFRVPDGSADSFLAASLNIASAVQHGADALVYHDVKALLQHGQDHQVAGCFCHDLINDEDVQIEADLVINASGAWAGKIASLAGVTVQMLPGKGTMLALNQRVVNTVINRCKMPSDGDILVPTHTVAVMGTTDIKVADPDQISIEPWEIRLMLAEGEKILPGFSNYRLLRAWAGVRPLFQETVAAQNRDVTRAFVLLDHAQRDGIQGLLTITSGKWTTYRKMAEVTVDKVCQVLGVERPCRTHLETLPSPGEAKAHHHHLGTPLEKIERDMNYGQLVCECELATLRDVERAILADQAHTLDDIRRDIRLGMGPCQGGFCTLRAAGLLHQLRHPAVEETNNALRDFLSERWKGLLPVLWGQQLRQERLNELIYLDVLNADHLPGPRNSRLSADKYALPAERPATIENDAQAKPVENVFPVTFAGTKPDVLVIGAGLAGLVCAWRTALRGKSTRLVAKGWGALYWGSGCIDILGYHPLGSREVIHSPLRALEKLIQTQPEHPYALAGIDSLQAAIQDFQSLCASRGYPMQGSLGRNWLLPTALGTLRPTCLAPDTMQAGDAQLRAPMLVAGFDQYFDFYPSLVGDNLNAQDIFASAALLNLPTLRKRRFVTAMVLARLFDTPEFREEVADALKPLLGRAARVGFPAVLGLEHATQACQHLASLLGVPVFEMPGLSPSIPGMRLHKLLLSAIREHGGQVFDGMQGAGFRSSDHRVEAIFTEAASRHKPHLADCFVLATGGILGGGILTHNRGYAQEMIFHLPVDAPGNRQDWLETDFLHPSGHPIFRTGISVTAHFQPAGEDNQPAYDNLFAAGAILGHCDPLCERSLEGIALASGYAVGEQL